MNREIFEHITENFDSLCMADAGQKVDALVWARNEIERLEAMLERARDAIESAPEDAFGSVPETHDCPAYPTKDSDAKSCPGNPPTEATGLWVIQQWVASRKPW